MNGGGIKKFTLQVRLACLKGGLQRSLMRFALGVVGNEVNPIILKSQQAGYHLG